MKYFVAIILIVTSMSVSANSDDDDWNKKMKRLNFAQDKKQAREFCDSLQDLKIIAMRSTRNDLYNSYQETAKLVKN